MLICDGHSSHFTIDVLNLMIANRIHLILRPLHPSQVSQGEDNSNFGKFKSAYRAKKASMFGEKFLTAQRKNPGTCALTLQDLTEITRESWQDALSSVSN